MRMILFSGNPSCYNLGTKPKQTLRWQSFMSAICRLSSLVLTGSRPKRSKYLTTISLAKTTNQCCDKDIGVKSWICVDPVSL